MAVNLGTVRTEAELRPALAHYWHPVLTSDEVGERPTAARLLGERIVIFRAGGSVHCLRDLCVHRGTPLSLGWLEGDRLVCAYHGWQYAPDGVCVRIPSLPLERGIPSKARVQAFTAAERYGLIWVCLGEPRAPIPQFPEYGDPSLRQILDYGDWACSAARFVENVMDFSHFPWVHEGLLGHRDDLPPSDYPLRREGTRLFYEYFHEQRIKAPYSTSLHTYRVTLPFTLHLERTEPGRPWRQVLFFTVSPTSAREARWYQFNLRNFGPDPSPDGASRGSVIVEQDRIIVENQRPEELPLDLSEELHLKGPDAAALAYRRLLRELGVE